MSQLVAAVFNNVEDAKRAVDWFWASAVPQSAISVLTHNPEVTAALDTSSDAVDNEIEHEIEQEHPDDAGRGAMVGAGVGAAVGVIFGLAAASIPGIGPFITAGALASTLGATGGAAAAGAIVGGTSGGIAGALGDYGVDSHTVLSEVEQGGVFIGVDVAQTMLHRDTVEEVLRNHHGQLVTPA